MPVKERYSVRFSNGGFEIHENDMILSLYGVCMNEDNTNLDFVHQVLRMGKFNKHSQSIFYLLI